MPIDSKQFTKVMLIDGGGGGGSYKQEPSSTKVPDPKPTTTPTKPASSSGTSNGNHGTATSLNPSRGVVSAADNSISYHNSINDGLLTGTKLLEMNKIQKILYLYDYDGNAYQISSQEVKKPEKTIGIVGGLDEAITSASSNSNQIITLASINTTAVDYAEIPKTTKVAGLNSSLDTVSILEKEIPAKYFTTIVPNKRTYAVDELGFDYLTYLVFGSGNTAPVAELYEALDYVLDNKLLQRENDPHNGDASTDPVNILGVDNAHKVLTYIWESARTAETSVKNVIGFYIYFHRRLSFLAAVFGGRNVGEVLKNTDPYYILNILYQTGIYPLTPNNLFDRLLNSFKLSVVEGDSRGEIKMSLSEYLSYDVTKQMQETYMGTPIAKDKLLVGCKIDKSKFSNKYSFSSTGLAYNAFKRIGSKYVEYNTPGENSTEPGPKNYLTKMIPNKGDVFTNGPILLSINGVMGIKEWPLWITMEAFDGIFKINMNRISKRYIKLLFDDFFLSDLFDKKYDTDITIIWSNFVNYINYFASVVTTELINSKANDHNYEVLFDNLVKLVNAKYILNYLVFNKVFSQNYTDGTLYVDAALQKTYASIAELKKQLKDIIDYITVQDFRFTAKSSV